MRRHRGWLSGLLALAIAGGAWAQGVGPGGDPGKPAEDPVKAAIERFQKEYGEGQKKKDEGMRATALDIFNGLCTDKRVLDVVGKVLNNGSETVMVKIKAATLLGQSGNVQALSTLDKAFSPNEKNDAVLEVVRQIGGIQDKSALKILEKIVRPRINAFDDEKKCNIARAGIDSIGRERFVESIDLLVKLYEPVNQGKPTDPTAIPEGDQARESQRSQTEGALVAALTALTAQPHQTFDDWKKWWSKEKKTFKFQ